MSQEMSSEAPEPFDKVRQTIVDIYNRFLSVARANTCFGDPIQVDDKTLIPAAEVICATGFGVGYGEADEEAQEKEANAGGGGGGGGFTRSRSVAVIVVSREGITVEPVVDATQIALAGVAATAFVGYWILRLMKNVGEVPEKGKGPTLRSFMGAVK